MLSEITEQVFLLGDIGFGRECRLLIQLGLGQLHRNSGNVGIAKAAELPPLLSLKFLRQVGRRGDAILGLAIE